METYAYSKVDIEGVGCFTVAKPVRDLLVEIGADRDYAIEARDAAIAERDAARASAQLSETVASERLGEMYRLVDQRNAAIAERDALRDALVSLVDGKSEFDIEFDTGMPADEARRIMDLAYQRK